MITKGGLAQPWTKDGSQGSAVASVSYNLNVDPYEKEDFSKKDLGSTKIVHRLLQIHNQGYSRQLSLPESKNFILDDGWHNLRNDITGSIGFEFKVKGNQVVSHLGMWDDHDREIPIRDPRGIPKEFGSDQPSKEGKRPRSIRSEHWIKLWDCLLYTSPSPRD